MLVVQGASGSISVHASHGASDGSAASETAKGRTALIVHVVAVGRVCHDNGDEDSHSEEEANEESLGKHSGGVGRCLPEA